MSSAVVVLASASPRRRELLAALGLEVRVRPVGLDESVAPGEAPADYVQRLAAAKAGAAAARLDDPETVVVAADTAVVADAEIYGKPASAADFRRMIDVLAGRCHEVYTAVAVSRCGDTRLRTTVTEVCLRPLSRGEAERYWATGEPSDKAGGYAIQGLGAIFVSSVKGSYSGVVGLPLFETAELLAAAGIDVLAAAAAAAERGA